MRDIKTNKNNSVTRLFPANTITHKNERLNYDKDFMKKLTHMHLINPYLKILIF